LCQTEGKAGTWRVRIIESPHGAPQRLLGQPLDAFLGETARIPQQLHLLY
jgi:hypothetical protein